MTTTTETLRPQLDQLQKVSLILGLVIVAGSAAAAFTMGQQAEFFQSYLIGFFFWTGIALSCWGLCMLHHLVTGRWGFVLQRVFESGMSTFPLLFVLFLPILLLGMQDLYPWARPEAADDPLLQHKEAYLNYGFFVVRAVIYFAIWIGVSSYLIKWSNAQDESGDPALSDRLQALSGPGMPLFALTVTFASFDWLMSLDPHWFSTLYGVMMIVSAGGATMAFAIIMMNYLHKHEPLSRFANAGRFYEWGKIELAFMLLWFYMMLSQFLIIWAANLPEETPWYIHRSTGGWEIYSFCLILLRFVVPFCLLLSIPRKKNPKRLVRVAVLILVMHFADLFWHIMPNFSQHGVHIGLLNIALPLGIGGIWFAVFLMRLKSRPIIPQKDPRFAEYVEAT
ncbi:MAG: hypothetical protein HOH43_06865 [Candidatus Latescibacteria bacterium]|jgi:hypothetical protein|nr:hypothetical protein [Candidatus Latescibacterota bacterium]